MFFSLSLYRIIGYVVYRWTGALLRRIPSDGGRLLASLLLYQEAASCRPRMPSRCRRLAIGFMQFRAGLLSDTESGTAPAARGLQRRN